jgi:pilus assembly protein Flp/PilA
MLNESIVNPAPVTVRDFTDNRERGASLVEYSLLVALIAVVCIVAVGELGTTVSGKFTNISEKIAG